MIVVYGMTGNLYNRIKPSVTSLLEHNDAKIYCLAEDDHVHSLPSDSIVINVKDQKIFPRRSPNIANVCTYMVLMRLVYPSLIPEDRVISLDVDTIILDSLSPIWETDLTGKWMAAVPEYRAKWRPYGDTYYNAGVAVYNLKQMREDNIESELVNLVNTQKLRYAEQDALNYFGLMDDKIVPLPVRYNESFCCGKTNDPAVVHYAGHSDWWDNPNVDRHDILEQYKAKLSV